MEFAVGTLTTAGCTYSCKITYDTPTRSGDNVTIKNVKATITSTSQYQTLNRIAVSVSINGSSKASNKQVLAANDTSYPTSKEVTIVDSTGFTFACLNKTFSISVTFRSTGYGSDWSNNYGSVGKNGSISCPMRTYTVTYDANGGTWGTATQTKEYGVTLKLATGDGPSKSSYIFKGWSGSDGNTYQKGDDYTGNAALTLTAVWQALSTELDDVADTEIGDYPSVSFTPPSEDLDYYITFSIGTWSHTTDMISPASTDKYTFNSYALPYEVCNQIPNSETGLMQVDLETYSGGTKTGTATKYFTVTVPDDVVPEFNTITLERATENALELYLENYSKVSATIYIDKAYLSDIAEVTMTIGDDTYVDHPLSVAATYTISYITSDVLKVHGSTTITFTATDTRGHTATTTETITVYEYDLPSATIDMTYDGNTIITDTVVAHFSEMSGTNSATISISGGPAHAFDDGQTFVEQIQSDYNRSRNHTCTVVITDLVTSVTVTKTLRPGRANRFGRLYDSKYYVGMDEEGWKRTDATFDGGITEDGVIWIERTGGTGPLGIGFPVVLDQDTDYELIYSTGAMDEPAAFVSFFREVSPSEAGTYYVSTTYDGSYLKSGDIFHTPKFTMPFKLWGVVVLGAIASENTVRNEYSDVIVRKITQTEESLEWDVETGNLGLDTPNQKYISRIQQRVDYSGSLKVEIAYDNADDYSTVHESTSDHMRSITVPIKVKRSDHFRIRLSGTGEVRLYSFGYQTDEGGDRCLI